jgi:hypothetical protein
MKTAGQHMDFRLARSGEDGPSPRLPVAGEFTNDALGQETQQERTTGK